MLIDAILRVMALLTIAATSQQATWHHSPWIRIVLAMFLDERLRHLEEIRVAPRLDVASPLASGVYAAATRATLDHVRPTQPPIHP